jgi:hypothetical protein
MLQSELALAAHGGAPSRRRAAPAIDLAAIETPGLTGWDRWCAIAQIIGERSTRIAEAAALKKRADCYVRAVHVPFQHMRDMPAAELIGTLRGMIHADREYLAKHGRPRCNLGFRRLVRTAYLAERLEVLRQRAAQAQRRSA